MSDYMFMLESHLSTDQFRVVGRDAEDRRGGGRRTCSSPAARCATCWADFRCAIWISRSKPVALKLLKAIEKHGATMVSTDELRKCVELTFPGGVTAELAMARSEKYPKAGGKPQMTPAATIHEDLRWRDFTVNAIALSLNKASLGLPIDPTNGVGDIERKELRAIHNYAFYDDPSRMLRLIRFKVRLGYTIDERTRLQYENAREAEMLSQHHARGAGLGTAAHGGGAAGRRRDEGARRGETDRALFAGAGRPEAESGDLRETAEGAPDWRRSDYRMHAMPLFLAMLFEKLNAKERDGADQRAGLTKAEVNAAQKTGRGGEKLERDLKGAKLQEDVAALPGAGESAGRAGAVPDGVFGAAAGAGPHQELFPEVSAAVARDHGRNGRGDGRGAGDAEVPRAKEEMILTRLDARPKKAATGAGTSAASAHVELRARSRAESAALDFWPRMNTNRCNLRKAADTPWTADFNPRKASALLPGERS